MADPNRSEHREPPIPAREAYAADQAEKADRAVHPDQPTYPPPPADGTKTTEPVEEEDLPEG